MNSQFNQIGAIKDFAIGIYDGPHATPAESDQGSVFLGIKNITPDGRLDLTDIRYISEQDLPKWTRRVTPQKDDIVFSYEATLHRYALIPENFMGCLGRRMALVRPDLSKICPRFLHYYFLSEAWRSVIESNLISGATVDRIPIARFPNFTIKIPVLSQQNKIANILSAYDDLIENNRRRIQLLERSLHLLYKEWFVHLRFPSHEHSKIVDGIPEGWENKKITELSVVIDGTHDSPKPTDNGYYMVTGRHIINGFIDFSKCYFISEEDHRQVMQRSKPEKGDIIFSNIGTLGSTVLVDQDFEFSIKNLALFKPHKKIYSNYLYGFFSDPRRIEDLNNQSSGTSQKFFSLKFLRSLSILTPPLPILEYFDDLAQPILKQRSLLHYENIKLQQARDLLLPKLMSGAISV